MRRSWPCVAAVIAVAVGADSPSTASSEEPLEAFDAAYWDALYGEPASMGLKDFQYDWYGVNLDQLRDNLAPRVPASRNAHVLVLGCGDSGLPQSLFDAGWRVTAVDKSQVVIDTMAARAPTGQSDLTWLVADAADLPLQAGSFDAAIEVGLLDALETLGMNDTAASTVLAEAHRVLRQGASLFSVSMQPPAYRTPLLEQNPKQGWTVEVVRLPRQRQIDHRIADLNPDFELNKLALYVATASSPPSPPPRPLSAEDPATVAQQDAQAATGTVGVESGFAAADTASHDVTSVEPVAQPNGAGGVVE